VLACENIPEQHVGLIVTAISTQEPIIKYDRHCSLGKLMRVVVYVLRFSYNTRCKAKDRRLGCVSSLEISNVRLALVKIVQTKEFENKIRLLRYKENIPKGSKLISLNPYLDDCHILQGWTNEIFTTS